MVVMVQRTTTAERSCSPRWGGGAADDREASEQFMLPWWSARSELLLSVLHEDGAAEFDDLLGEALLEARTKELAVLWTVTSRASSAGVMPTIDESNSFRAGGQKRTREEAEITDRGDKGDKDK